MRILRLNSFRLLIAAFALSAFALMGGPATAQEEGSFNVPGSCVREDASENPVVRAGVPSGAVSGGIVGCKIIHNGDRFVLSPATIGNLGVIQRGVQSSVEVFGIAGGGGVVQFGQQIQVCLRGTGEFIYMSAVNTPRIPSELPAVTRDIDGTLYTCGVISSTGTAVLVAGEQAPLADEAGVLPVNAAVDADLADEAETLAEGEVAAETTEEAPTRTVTTTANGEATESLSGCRVTTTAMVRMRNAPTTQDSEILTRLPFELSVQAINRTVDEDWYNVVYGDQDGWVSGNYLNPSAGCFE